MDWKVATGIALTAVGILGLAVLHLRSKRQISSPQPDPKSVAETKEHLPKPFAEISPKDLFNVDELSEKVVAGLYEATLEFVCEFVLTALKNSAEKEFAINRRDNSSLLPFFRYGLPKGADINGPHQSKSYVIRVLVALQNKGYISEFKVEGISQMVIRLN
ncbi:MAG: hypothetical protein JSS10_06640 [Verrucomicrobia bacterium]|nr:hypothetical protein [Verrucomicrobiota bacterium]